MARGSQQAIEIPVSLQLQNLAEIANSLKKFANENILSDSFNGKKINAELQTVLRTLAQIETRAKNGFKVDSDFGGLNKDINRVELSLDNVYKSINKLHFEDLQIPEDVQGRLQELNAEIKQLRDNFNGVKEAQKNALVNNGQFVLDLNKAFPANSSKIIGKTYDEIGQAIQDGTTKIQARLDEQQRILQQKQLLLAENKAGQANFAAQNVLNFLEKGFKELPKNPDAKLNEQQQILQQYMKISADDKGNREFSSFKNGASYNSFFNYLVKQYELTPEQLDQIKQRIRDQMAATKKSAAQVMKEMALDREIGAKIMVNTSRDQMINEASKYASQVKDTSATEATVQKLREQGNAANAAWQSFQGTVSIVSAANEQLRGALQGPQTELEKLQQSVLENAIALPQFSQAQQQAAASLDQLRAAASVGEQRLKQMNETVSKMDGVSNFINRYIGLYAIVRKVSTAIRNAFNNIKELDKTITSIAVVTNMSQEDLWGKIGEYTQMAQQYGVAVKGVYEVSQIFYQQGLQTSQVMALTTETLKMAKIAGIDYSTAANAMTVAVRAFKLEMTDAQQVTDTYSALAAKFAVSSAEIANAMEKTASSAASVGMSLESTSAFISVMEQTTRESAQNIGSALKSIISRYGEMKASPSALLNVDGEEVAFNKVDTALKSIGISIKDASGQFRDFDDVIMELAQKWNSLDNNTQRYIATIMAGNRQQSRFIALVSNYDELSRAMDTAANAENASVVQVAKTMDSLESKANQLQNAFSQLYLDLHVEDGLKGAYDWLTKILKTIGKLGVGKGLLPSLMNVIGLGTGTKKLIGMSKEAYTNRVKKVQVEVEDKNNKIQEIQNWIKQPEEKVIQLKMDDSQLQQAQINLQNATTTISTDFVNKAVFMGANVSPQQIYDKLKGAQNSGEFIDKEKFLSSIGIDKDKVGEQNYTDLTTSLETINTFNSQLQSVNTTLASLQQSGQQASNSLNQVEQSAVQESAANDVNTNSKVEAAQADYDKALAARNAAQEDLNKAREDAAAAEAASERAANDSALSESEKELLADKAASRNAEVEAAKEALTKAEADRRGAEEALQKAQADAEGAQSERDEANANRDSAQSEREEANANRGKGGSGESGKYSGALMKGIGIASGLARIGGTALAAWGASQQDKSTDTKEYSKIYTGIGNGLSAAGTGASMLMGLGPWGAAVGAIGGFLLGGLGAIIDGAEMTLAEKIALQKEEVQKAQDENLKAQAKATDLSSQIDNIKNLKKVMYDSTEDMQAYKDAMNTMADQYPQLISSYDEAGNAIIDLNSAEEALAEARLAGAKAARQAIIKEGNLENSQRQALTEALTAVRNQSGYSESKNFYALAGTYTESNSNAFRVKNGDGKTVELESSSSIFGARTQTNSTAYYKNAIRNAMSQMPEFQGKNIQDLSYEDVETIVNALIEHPEWGGDSTYTIKSPYVTMSRAINKSEWEAYRKQYFGENSDNKAFTYDVSKLNKVIKEYSDLFNGAETVQQLLKLDADTPIHLKELEDAEKEVERVLAQNEAKLKSTRIQSNMALSQEALFSATDNNINLSTAGVNNIQSKKIYSQLFNQILNNFISSEDIKYTDALDWYSTEGEEEAFREAAQKQANSFILWYQSLSTKEKEILESLDFTEYTSVDQIMSKIGIKPEDNQEIYNAFAEQFIESNKANRDRILKTIYEYDENGYWTGRLNKDLKGLSKFSTFQYNGTQLEEHNKAFDITAMLDSGSIISKYSDYFTTSLVSINKLAEEGYTELAANRLNILSAFSNTLSQMTSSEQQDMFGILTQVDLSSYESIQTAKESLKNYTKEKGITFEGSQFEELWNELDESESKLIFNVTTLANTLATQIESAAKDMDSILSTNKSGLSFDKALEEYKTLSAKFSDLGNFDTVFSYDAVLGKYVYTQDGLQKAIQAREQNLQDTAERLTKEEEKLTQKIAVKVDDHQWEVRLVSGLYKEDAWKDEKATLQAFNDSSKPKDLVGLEADYQELIKKYWSTNPDEEKTYSGFIDFLMEESTRVSKEAEAAQKILQEYQANKKNQYYQAIDWSKLALGTDISGTNKNLMESLAKELGILVEDFNEAGVKIGEYWVEGYQGTWKEVLDKYLKETYKDENARKIAEAALNGQIKQQQSQSISTAIIELLNGAGSAISEETAALLYANGQFEEKLDDNGLLKAGLDYVQSALDLFEATKSELTTAAERNAAYRAILNKQFEGANATISFLSSGAALDGSAIDNFFNTLGLNLDEFYDGATNQWKNGLAKYLSTDIFGKTTVIDWNGFIDSLNLDQNMLDAFKNTFEYQNAYSSYVDGIIQLDTQLQDLIKKSYDNAFNQIDLFKEVNVSKLSDEAIELLTANGAATVNNGILVVNSAIDYANNAVDYFATLSTLSPKELYEETGWTSADLAKNWKTAQTVLTQTWDSWASIGNNLNAISTDQMSTLIEKGGLKIDDVEQAFTKVGDHYVLSLEKYADYLLKSSRNISPEQYQNKLAEARQAIINNITGLDWTKVLDGTVTDVDLTTFKNSLIDSLTSLGEDYKDVIKNVRTGELNVTDLITALQGVDQALADHIKETIAEIQNNILSSITSATTYNIEGTNDITNMQKFVDEYNKLIPNSNISIAGAFEYDTILDQFTLSSNILNEYINAQKEQLKNLGMSGKAIDEYIKDQTQTILQQNMNFIDFITTNSKKEKDQIGAELAGQIEKMWTLQGKAINHRLIADILRAIDRGGQAAVEKLKEIKGEEVTSEEIDAVYRAAINRINEAQEALESGEGTILYGLAAEIAKISNGIETTELPDGGIVITAVTSMADAYSRLYAQMKNTSEKTTSSLNNLYAKFLTSIDQPEIDVISIMNDAMGMTYDALGEMLANYGVELEEVIAHSSDYGLQLLGAGKVRILDFDTFISQIPGLKDASKNSDEYIEARKAYNKSLIELDKQIGQNLTEEIKSITEAHAGDKIDLTYLEKALGTENLIPLFTKYRVSFNKGIAKLTSATNIAGLIQDITQLAANNNELLPEELAELADAVSDYINNIINLIKSGISGSLKNTDAQKLQSWADQFGLNLDFTQTAEGLKLSQKSAIELYNALKGVDNIKSKLVFDELNKSLQETNEHYKSISDILQRINYIEKDVPDDRKIAYEEELALAKEILAVRSTSEDSSFSFMSNKIPGAQNNPINYFNNWASAIQKLQEAMKTTSTTSDGKTHKGLIDYQDWYNIATEMGNMAKVTGNKFKLAGITIDGSLEKTAALIEKGASALTVDSTGNLKVALGDIGIDFQAGASEMSSGIETGIQEMARSQVDMLNGLIALLELIVQMEQLGDIDVDGMGINFEEIFDPKSASGFSKAYEDWREAMLDQLKLKKGDKDYNEDLQNALKGTMINDQSLASILELTPSELRKLDKSTQDAYAAILDAFSKAAKSGNFDTDNIYESIKSVLAESGLGTELSITIGDTTLVIYGGQITSIDWKDANTEKVLKQWEEEGRGNREDLLEKIKQYHSGEAIDTKDLTFVLKLEKKLQIDDSGNVIVSINGKNQNLGELTSSELAHVQNWLALQDLGYEIPKTINIKEDDAEIEITKGVKTAYKIIYDQTNGLVYKDQFGHTGKSIEDLAKAWLENPPSNAVGAYHNEQEVIWGEFGIRAKVTPKVTATIDGKETEVSLKSGSEYRAKVEEDLQKLTQENLDNLGFDKTGNLEIELGGVKFTLSGDDVIDSTGKSNLEKVKTQIQEQFLGMDLGLQETIAEAIKKAFTEIPTGPTEDATKAAQEAGDKAKEATEKFEELGETAQNTKPEIDIDNTAAIKAIDAVKNDWESWTPTPKKATINTKETTSQTSGIKKDSNTNIRKDLAIKSPDLNSTPKATGTIGLAKAQGTLMGELGPELYVQNGRYFVAGQNGPEFVNLAPDAIVFNHLQTRSLLDKGMSPGRGKAVTNERTAVSYAKGNINGGPAMASASAALAALRQLRAQWKALMDLGVADLAGKGGGGGGGGEKDLPGFIRDVERWYNWLQKIADLEKQITYQEQLRSKIQSDMVSSGKAYYASQKQTYKDARDSALTSQSLFLSQKEFFNKRREQLNNSPLSELYTFDETGQLHYQKGSFNWLAQLFKTDDFGQLALNPQQQYEMILSRNPEFAQYMKYNSEGKEIKQEDYQDNKDQYYLDMVKAFSDRMDAEKEEMQNLFDSWNDQQKAVLEQMQKMNEQLQAMKDNQKEVEEDVLGAIVESRERQIKELQDTKDALQKSNQDFIDGLSQQLDKEQKMYQNNESDQELQRNRRQLAILQRSGGSAAQIASLQKQIEQQSRDQYFEKQQEQIDAVKEASDLQIERLDHQIEIEQEALEYQKANGLLWGEVYNVMKGTQNEIANFVTGNTVNFWSKSPLATTEDVNELIFKAEQWTQFRDDTKMQKAAMGRIDQNLEIFLAALEQIYGDQANWEEIKAKATEDYNKYYGIDNNDPNKTAWDSYPGKNDIEMKNTGKQTTGTTNTATTNAPNKTTNDEIDHSTISNSWYYNDVKHWKTAYTKDGRKIRVLEDKHVKDKGVSDGNRLHYKCKICGCDMGFIYEGMAEGLNKNAVDNGIANKSQQYNKISRLKSSVKNNNSDIEIIPLGKGVPRAANGAIVDQSGAAIIHDNEVILTAEQTRFLRDDILSNKSTSLLGILSSLHSSYKDISANTINNSEGNVIIENATVQMNVQKIADDYDARRAGDQAMEEMLRIARKSGTRSV